MTSLGAKKAQTSQQHKALNMKLNILNYVQHSDTVYHAFNVYTYNVYLNRRILLPILLRFRVMKKYGVTMMISRVMNVILLTVAKFLLCSNCTHFSCLCSRPFSDSLIQLSILCLPSLLCFLEPLLVPCQLFRRLSFWSFRKQNMLLARTYLVQRVEPLFSMFVALLVTAYTTGKNALFTFLTIKLCQNIALLLSSPVIHNYTIAVHVVEF